MSFWALAAIFVIDIIIGHLLRPRIKPNNPEKLSLPDTEEGVPIPDIIGVAELVPNIVWWGDAVSEPDPDDDNFNVYKARAQGTLCLGPIDQVVDIQFGDKSLSGQFPTKDQSFTGLSAIVTPPLPGAVRDPTDIFDNAFDAYISALQMFGGKTKEGGVAGRLRVYYGRNDQGVDPLSKHIYTTDFAPAFPNICWVAFGDGPEEGPWAPAGELVDGQFIWSWNVATPNPPKFIVRKIPRALGFGTLGVFDVNPMEMAYYKLTSYLAGLGITDVDKYIDVQAFKDAAQILQDEGLGLSCNLKTQQATEDFLDDLMRHVDGVMFRHPETGKITVRLARGGYLTEDLLVIDEDNSEEFTKEDENWSETKNEIKIKYRRFQGGSNQAGEVDGFILTPTFGTEPWSVFPSYPTGPGGGPAQQYTYMMSISNLRYNGATIGNNVVNNITLLRLYYIDPDTSAEVDITPLLFNAQFGLITIKAGDVPLGAVVKVDYIQADSSFFIGFQDAIAPWQNLANRQITGNTRSVTLEYEFITDPTVAAKVAARVGRSLSLPLRKAKWKMSRKGHKLMPGSVVAVNRPNDDIVGVPFRITRMNFGTLENGLIQVEALEDPYGNIASFNPPGGLGDGGTPIPNPNPIVAPDIFIDFVSCSIRIGLHPADTAFNIELHRATASDGTGDTLLSGPTGLAGTTTYYDDAQTVGDTFFYRARLIGNPSSGLTVTPGAWTPWTEMTGQLGDCVAPGCILPVVDESISETATVGTVSLSISDPQGRIKSVVFVGQTPVPSTPEPPVPTDPGTVVPPGSNVEPGTFTLFAEALNDAVPPGGTPSGWTGYWKDFGGSSLRTDQSGALISPSDALRFTLPTGLADGAGVPPIDGWAAGGIGSAEYSKVFARFCQRIGDTDYENHPVLTKLHLFGTGRPTDTACNDVIIGIMGTGVRQISSSWRMMIGVQNVWTSPLTPTSLFFSTGIYNIIDVQLETNDIGVANGKVTMWINGHPALYRDNFIFRTAAYPKKFWGYKTGIVWGGRGSVKTRDDHIWFDHTRLLGIA